MALSASNRAASLKLQPGAVFVAPTAPDDYAVAQTITMSLQAVEAESNEYTGTIFRPGAYLIGKRVSLTLRWLLRAPGGVAPPAADTFIIGRALQACGFSEAVTAAAIPAAPEAVSVGSTTGATLGAGAAGTAQLYRGMAIVLASQGAVPANVSAIKDYTAGKVMTLPETLGGALTGNYQIPAQLGYRYSSTAPTDKMMSRVHFDGVYYDLFNMVPTQLTIGLPTASLDTQEFAYVEVTFDAEISGWADGAAPALAAAGQPPMFRCGDQWTSNKALGGTGITITFNLTAERAPNPNTCNGEPSQITQSGISASLNLNHNLKSTIDLIALAEAGGYHSYWAQFGYTAGGIVSLLMPKARFSIPDMGENGNFVAQTVNLYVDEPADGVCLAFPYPA